MRGALGQLQISDGDPGDCQEVPHGEDCPGWFSRCICVDLRVPSVVEELKYLLWRAGNYAPSYSYSWSSSDESNLMAWALDQGGSNRELVARSSTGVIYPTGDGLTQLAISAGCAQKVGDVWVGCKHGSLDALAARALNGEGWLRPVAPIFRLVTKPDQQEPQPPPAPTPHPEDPSPEAPPEPEAQPFGYGNVVPALVAGAVVVGLSWWIWRS